MSRRVTEEQKARNRQYAREWRLNNPEKSRAIAKRWRALNPEKAKEQGRRKAAKWRAANLPKARAMASARVQVDTVSYRRRRGLPDPTRPRPKVCECCQESPEKQRVALDHCHVTGHFRGWLCFKCNTAIAKLGDSIEGLQRAIEYLQRAANEEKKTDGKE